MNESQKQREKRHIKHLKAILEDINDIVNNHIENNYVDWNEDINFLDESSDQLYSRLRMLKECRKK